MTRNNTLAGKVVKAYVFNCWVCGDSQTVLEAKGLPLTKAEAEKWARETGWTQIKSGDWMHRACPSDK